MKKTHEAGSIVTRRMKAFRTVTVLVPIFVVCFGLAFATTVGWQDGSLSVSPAYAKGGGNGGGNGGGHGRTDAPGQADKEIVDDDFGTTDDVGDAETVVSGDSRDELETDIPKVTDESAPATIQVIKELAGLPENSALSEEEELEAIRSGWGTWRTADPGTIMAQ